MKSKTLLAILSATLIVLPAILPYVSALEFSSNSISLCATDTAVFVTTITNQESFQNSYTVSLSGEGAKWAVAAPTGLTLKPGQSEQLYVYVTPSISALPGSYEVKVTVASFSKTETGSFNINVLDCHSAELTAQQNSQSICSATTAKYDLVLKNTGKYTENFQISVSGQARAWAEQSQSLISLAPNQTSQFSLHVTPPADQTGDFKLTVTAASQNSRALSSTELSLTSIPCYGFSAALETNYLSFCEASEVKVPLTIENRGSVANTYDIELSGPAWAKVENTKLEIGPGQSKSTNLILYPSYGVIGGFTVKLKIVPKIGSPQELEFNAISTSCYSADLKLSTKEVKLCPNTENIFTVSLKNTGKFPTKYALSLSGADFATIEKPFVELNESQSEEINLHVNLLNVEAGTKDIKVSATAQDPSKTTVSDSLKLEVAPASECYGVETTSALTQVEVLPGEPALVPIVINNKGLQNASYELELSGDGAQFVQLNPAALTLPGKTAKTVYAYIAVPEGTGKEAYTVGISARMKGSPTVVSTTNFKIVLGHAEKPAQVPQISMEAQTAALRQYFQQLLSRISEAIQGLKSKLTNLKPVSPQANQSSTKGVESEQNQTNATNETKTASTENIPIENISEIEKYLSPEALAKLKNLSTEEVNKSNKSEEQNESTTGAYAAKLSDLREKTLSALLPVKTFLTSTTYYAPNWIWIVCAILLFGVIGYLLRRKDLLDKFNAFLEETEQKGETGEEEKEERSGPSAQELLDSVGTEEKPKKRNSKNKRRSKSEEPKEPEEGSEEF